jgi:hypothetical protein
MGLFDRMKGVADDLVQGAKEKVSDATGVDADKLIDAAGSVVDAGGSLSDAAMSIEEGRLGHQGR